MSLTVTFRMQVGRALWQPQFAFPMTRISKEAIEIARLREQVRAQMEEIRGLKSDLKSMEKKLGKRKRRCEQRVVVLLLLL